MKINVLGIKNFKSFNSEGVGISLQKKVNIFIGKNNSGKSNILKFLKLFSENYDDLRKFPFNDLENQHARNGLNPSIYVSINLGELWPEYADQLGLGRFFEFHYKLPTLDLFNDHPLEEFPEQFLLKLQKQYSRAGKTELLKQIDIIIKRNILSELSFLKKLTYIPHFREIGEENNSDSIFSGNKIISQLFEMKNPKIGEEKNLQKFEKIQNFIKDLLGEKELSIDIPHSKDCIIIDLNNNRLTLESLGTGIHELIILCSALTLYDDHCFCIEEPELHLHPELQKKFIEYITTLENYFFISTHSNSLIDSNKNINIYNVEHTGVSSNITLAETNELKYQILQDMGYRASDILQTNGIIWVEGPSDRIFLNKWIQLNSPELIEGIHYSIMFYGGRLLSHLSFNESDELIDMLRLNRNSIVIIDRDGFSSNAKVNRTKKRINNELKQGCCWITKGREIENYLTEKTLLSFLSTFQNNPSYKYDADQKIENIIQRMNKQIKINYSDNKVKYSKSIVKFIENEDFSILDLKRRIDFLTNEIKNWNF